MNVVQAARSMVGHTIGVAAQSAIIAVGTGALALALSPVWTPAGDLVGSGLVNGGRLARIEVVMAGDGSRTSDASGSIFTAWGCEFRPSDPNYFMVVHGPAPDTKELAYWVDAFPVRPDGCGSATVSWSSSGVAGDFDVWVVRSASGNPWQARPASNVVTITITEP